MTDPITTDEQNAKTSRRLPDNADPAADYATAAERPGTLRGEASLLIQTRQAQRLVYGRRHSQEQAGIIGLVRFGMLMKRIWTAAMQDDPYADWFLLQVHEALEAGRALTQELKVHVDALLAGVDGVEITVAHSLKPVRVPLQFANPYGYMGAYVIADFDELVCSVLTAR
ncbi:MAG TPA: TIGR03761 family integrating conjugative element protein, partial [Arenicellales bacterium]|nr:TIGR03761 family integrating conjugative element protein [Arenicellales bacterium]